MDRQIHGQCILLHMLLLCYIKMWQNDLDVVLQHKCYGQTDRILISENIDTVKQLIFAVIIFYYMTK